MEAVQVATLGIRIALEDITGTTDPALLSSDSSQSIQITSCQSPPPPPVVPMRLPSPQPVLDAQDTSLSPPQARDRLPVSQTTTSIGHQHAVEADRPRPLDYDAPAAGQTGASQRPKEPVLAPPVDIVRISVSSLHPPNVSPTPSSVMPPSLAAPRLHPPPQPHTPVASTSTTPAGPFPQSGTSVSACNALPLSPANAEPRSTASKSQCLPIPPGQQLAPPHSSTTHPTEDTAATSLLAAGPGVYHSIERHPAVVPTSAAFPASHASTARSPAPPPSPETGAEAQPSESHSTARSVYGASPVTLLHASNARVAMQCMGFQESYAHSQPMCCCYCVIMGCGHAFISGTQDV